MEFMRNGIDVGILQVENLPFEMLNAKQVLFGSACEPILAFFDGSEHFFFFLEICVHSLEQGVIGSPKDVKLHVCFTQNARASRLNVEVQNSIVTEEETQSLKQKRRMGKVTFYL